MPRRHRRHAFGYRRLLRLEGEFPFLGQPGPLARTLDNHIIGRTSGYRKPGFRPVPLAPAARSPTISWMRYQHRPPVEPAASFDFVLTDPPDVVEFTGHWNRKHEPIQGDDTPEWLEPIFREVYRLMKPDTLCLSYYGWPHADLFLSTWKAVGFRPVSHLAFVKRVRGLGWFIRSQHETAYLLVKGHPASPEVAISDTLDWVRETDSFHPNQKSVAAILPILIAYTAEGEIVLDPFMGSGSTLRAAKEPGAGRSASRLRNGTVTEPQNGWSRACYSRRGPRHRCLLLNRRCSLNKRLRRRQVSG